MFTDESIFNQNGIFYQIHAYLWAGDNHDDTASCWICGHLSLTSYSDQTFYHHAWPPDKYLNFLEHVLLHFFIDVLPNGMGNIWLKHDAKPYHYSLAVCAHLNSTFPHRCIGSDGPVSCATLTWFIETWFISVGGV